MGHGVVVRAQCCNERTEHQGSVRTPAGVVALDADLQIIGSSVTCMEVDTERILWATGGKGVKRNR